jgi:hypothetical protein
MIVQYRNHIARVGHEQVQALPAVNGVTKGATSRPEMFLRCHINNSAG